MLSKIPKKYFDALVYRKLGKFHIISVGNVSDIGIV